MSKFNRIGICGVSGVGKTTLATHITKTSNIPYLSMSSSVLWPLYGYEHHHDVVADAKVNPFRSMQFQEELVDFREKKLREKKLFITDRTPIDQLTYLLSYFPENNTMEFQILINKLREQCLHFDAIIYIPYTNGQPIENNGKRILNPLYQLTMDGIMNMILSRNVLRLASPILKLDTWNFHDRVMQTNMFLGHDPNN